MSSSQFTDLEDTGEFPVYDANSLIANIDRYDQENEYISIIKDGAGVGRISKRSEKSSVIATMGYIIPYRSELNYTFSLMQTIDFNKFVNGSTIPHIYFKDYGNEQFYIPLLEEQIKIGQLFEGIDNLITLHQRMLLHKKDGGI